MNTRTIAITFLCGFAAAMLWAQVTTYSQPRNFAYTDQIKPQAVPTTAADIVTSDAYVEEIDLTNTSGSTVKVTITDRQSSAQPIFVASIAAGDNIAWPLKHRWAPAGINWVADGAGVTGYMAWSH